MSTVGIDDLEKSMAAILAEYADQVYLSTEEGLDAAQKVLIGNLSDGSPKDRGRYAKSWAADKRKYKLMRFVGNTTEVQGKRGGKPVPLSNILEYASKSPHKGKIKRIYDQSIKEMVTAVEEELMRGV